MPDEAHREHAHLWCEKGEVNSGIGRFDQARADFEMCIAWTEGDPGLGDIRAWAEEMIGSLEGR